MINPRKVISLCPPGLSQMLPQPLTVLGHPGQPYNYRPHSALYRQVHRKMTDTHSRTRSGAGGSIRNSSPVGVAYQRRGSHLIAADHAKAREGYFGLRPKAAGWRLLSPINARLGCKIALLLLLFYTPGCSCRSFPSVKMINLWNIHARQQLAQP